MTDGQHVEEGVDDLNRDQRLFRDPIHEYVVVPKALWPFIDTEHFQRLRRIKQLGTSYYVWPGASHNRFEHCLGVAHLARRMVKHLQEAQPKLGITERDVTCVQLAGLCHDLGHGPWSHVFDGYFIPQALPGRSWKHEDASEMMFDHLIEKNKIEMCEDDVRFVKALIAGDPSKCSPKEKRYLFDIVANKRNGIDVDKFDYMARDNYHLGDKDNVSFNRLIHSARVIENQICWNFKDVNMLQNLCYTRFNLHKSYYTHKTARAIEFMIVDGLLKAEPYMQIAKRIDNPDRYLHLTDAILERIQESEEPGLAEARAIFRRINHRDLYRLVDQNVFDWASRSTLEEAVTPELIVEAAKSLADDSSSDVSEEDRELAKTLEVGHVIVDIGSLHYGMKERNPIDFIKFYSKDHPNECSYIRTGEFATLLPASFGEIHLRIFTRDAKYRAIIQAGYRDVIRHLPSYVPLGQDSETEESLPAGALTPPDTTAPTTPRMQLHASLPPVAGSTPSTVPSGTPGSVNTPHRALVRDSSRTTPFTANHFLTAPKNIPPSPTQADRRPLSTKRQRADEDDEPVKKQRST